MPERLHRLPAIWRRFVWGAVLVAGLTGPFPVLARTIAVPAQAPTIKGAMIQARAGDIILVACGTYRENDIMVKPGVSLWSGTLRADCVTIDAEGRGRCLIFSQADSTTQVAGFTLRGGRVRGAGAEGSGGAVLSEDSAPRISHCVLTGNSAEQGGALAATGASGPRLESCEFIGNSADRDGGAVLWTARSGSLLGCTLRDNHALGQGGALAGRSGNVQLDRCLIAGNSAGQGGGGLSLADTPAEISGSVLTGNAGGLGGGAIASVGARPLLRHCTFYANLADGEAAVLRLDRSNPRLEACLIAGSRGPLLGAVESSLAISGSIIHAVGAEPWGGLLADAVGHNGNLAADPLFCAPEAGDLNPAPNSPCRRQDGQPAIGALDTGCGAKFPTDVLD